MIWSLDENDLRPHSGRTYGLIPGLTLRQAMLVYDEEDLAERFYELEAQGYGGEPPPLVSPEGWRTPREELINFGRCARELREAKGKL